MTKRWDAVTFGEIYVDHVFSELPHWPQPGEEVFTRHYLRELGGGAAITACGLGLLGRQTAVFGVVGELEAEWIKNRLEGNGVEAEGLLELPGSSGMTMSVSVGDERSFYSYHGANAGLSEYLASPALLERLKEARHVHFAVPLQRHLASFLVQELKGAGCSISLDVGWQPEWYQNPANLQTCREIDYFLPNRKEAEFLTGRQGPSEILLGLEALGFSNVVIKLGADGAAIHTEGGMLLVGSPPVRVIDTTGAGDAFDAGLIDAILDKVQPMVVLQRAAICGALSTRQAGALNGLATRKDLEEVYERT